RDDPSITVRFAVKDRPNEYLLIWTTTPRTLPANMADAAHPDATYAKVLVRRGGTEETYYVAQELVEHNAGLLRWPEHYVVGHVSGRDLSGTAYVHPFEGEVQYHATPRGPHHLKVVLADYVALENTGLVHTAPGHGADDFETGVEYDLPPFCPVGEDGRYTAEAGPYRDLPVKEADARILGDLAAKGALVASGEITHSYGHCWRCKTPILFRATDQWFLAMTRVKDQMLAEVERVRWTPEWAGSARQREWVREARDWCISRQRYWGIPIPVWQCPEGCTEVIGTRKELAKRAKSYRGDPDLHRPSIDRVTFPCKVHKAEMRRVPDVLDVWFDSAVASWASLGYPGNKREFARWFPCAWIVEGLDQTRGWFYSQLAAGVVALDRIPYESVTMHGFVHDAEGRPMSKSLGNVIAPQEVIDRHGADAFRFYVLGTSAPWEDIPFSWEGVKNTARNLGIVWNVHVFATQYMALDAFDPAALPFRDVRKHLTPEDKWLYSRMQTVSSE
ncbi:MAG: class I tRNA ligase family protein, partial [Methanobacteriota archaeon]